MLIFHPCFIPRKTHTNNPFAYATLSLFSGSTSSATFQTNNTETTTDSFGWIELDRVGYVLFSYRNFAVPDTILKWRNMFIFAVDVCGASPCCRPLGRVFFKMFILFMMMLPYTIAWCCTCKSASVCAWMSAVCQFLRLLSFEYVAHVNNFNIYRIFILAFTSNFQLYTHCITRRFRLPFFSFDTMWIIHQFLYAFDSFKSFIFSDFA